MSSLAPSPLQRKAVWNALTKREEHAKTQYVWVIEDTERVFPVDKEVRSPKFTITGINNTDFEIVCKEVYWTNVTRCLNIELHPVNHNVEYKIAVDLEVTVGEQKQTGKVGDITNCFINKEVSVLTHLFQNTCPIHPSYPHWFGQQTGSTSVTLGFTFCSPGKLLTTTTTTTTTQNNECNKLDKDLKSLLEGEDLFDFTIRCRKTELKCHANILYARSVYFARLFSSDMVEMKNREMEIVEFEPETVAMMLQYLYTGDVDTTEKDLGELLALAHKYQLTGLRILAGERLSEEVTEDNVLDVFILAETHGAEDLKQVAINKVIGNRETLMKNEEFRKKLLECPSLMMELLTI